MIDRRFEASSPAAELSKGTLLMQSQASSAGTCGVAEGPCFFVNDEASSDTLAHASTLVALETLALEDAETLALEEAEALALADTEELAVAVGVRALEVIPGLECRLFQGHCGGGADGV